MTESVRAKDDTFFSEKILTPLRILELNLKNKDVIEYFISRLIGPNFVYKDDPEYEE